jgi:hypothetical protein
MLLLHLHPTTAASQAQVGTAVGVLPSSWLGSCVSHLHLLTPAESQYSKRSTPMFDVTAAVTGCIMSAEALWRVPQSTGIALAYYRRGMHIFGHCELCMHLGGFLAR